VLFHDVAGRFAARRHREADGAVLGLDLHHQRAQHVDAEALARLAILGVFGHRGRNMVVDPVARALIVIIGPAAFCGKGANLIRGKGIGSSSSATAAALFHRTASCHIMGI
jgi:hypothetical protein